VNFFFFVSSKSDPLGTHLEVGFFFRTSSMELCLYLPKQMVPIGPLETPHVRFRHVPPVSLSHSITPAVGCRHFFQGQWTVGNIFGHFFPLLRRSAGSVVLVSSPIDPFVGVTLLGKKNPFPGVAGCVLLFPLVSGGRL